MNILTKENSNILRGLAIMSIMLHNFLHLGKWGFSSENEMAFSQEKANAFFNALKLGQTNVFGELFSFLGWIGVPVFIFLTGYGITLQRNNVASNRMAWIKRNWLKLFVLMLPALLFFCLLDIRAEGFSLNLLKRALYLTQMANVAYPYIVRNPGVYWYFGLTFQLYLIWAIFGSKLKGWSLLLVSITTILFLYICCVYASPEILSIYKHCFMGWFEIFAFGIFLAQSQIAHKVFSIPWYLELILLLILSAVIFLLNYKLETWLFLPFTSLIAFLLLGDLILKIKYLSSIFRWIGTLSAFIFVCHPIVRILAIHISLEKGLFLILFMYISLTFLFSIVYKYMYKKLLSFLEKNLYSS